MITMTGAVGIKGTTTSVIAAPIANFTATPTSGATPLSVSFTDTSTGSPTSWLWDFKNDGTATSTQQNPTYQYTSPGVYTVKLTVTNLGGTNTITKTNFITVATTPTANFTATPTSGFTPLSVSFTDTSANSPTSWLWDFKNDGTATSTQQNPTYQYSTSGTYTVKMTATNLAGSNTVTKTNFITASPVRNTTKNLFYSTISSAVAAASSGDVIEVAAGVYEEQISINVPLTLRGPNFNKAGNDPTRVSEAIIRVNKSMGEYASVLSPNTNNITIEGFTIDCPDSLMEGANPIFAPYPVRLNAQNNFTFRNNRMYGGEIPLSINPNSIARSGLLIEGNYIDCGPFVNDSYNRAMYIFNSQGIVQDNVIVNASTGIQFSVQTNITLSAASTIRRNTISAALNGLYNNVMPRGTAQHNWQQNTITVSPNDRLGLKLLVGGPNAQWGPLGQANWAAARIQYMGTEGASSTPPTVTFTNNTFDASRDPTKVYNNVDWFGFQLSLAGSTGNGISVNSVITGSNNSITGWNKAVRNISAGTGNFANNWWGTTNLTAITSTVVNTGGGTVTIAPILNSGVDSDPATPGFQP